MNTFPGLSIVVKVSEYINSIDYLWSGCQFGDLGTALPIARSLPDVIYSQSCMKTSSTLVFNTHTSSASNIIHLGDQKRFTLSCNCHIVISLML